MGKRVKLILHKIFQSKKSGGRIGLIFLLMVLMATVLSRPAQGFLQNFALKQSRNVFRWISGSTTTGLMASGNYGIKGSSNPQNVVSGRRDSGTWTDASGNLWIFGGFSYDRYGNVGYTNDLWKYNPATDEWVWISGSSEKNPIGSYGTKGVSHPDNNPGARAAVLTWYDDSSGSAKLWLFGGFGYDSVGTKGYLNDLWLFNLTDGQWTWVGGSKIANQAGVYGTKGTAGPGNIPGARYGSTAAFDNVNHVLWLFGGQGYVSGSAGFLNDLWKYDLSTGNWTWIAGPNSINGIANYGTKGSGTPSTLPGSRYYATIWFDGLSSAVWLHGGYGYPSSASVGYLTDLWKYDLAASKWVWMSGLNSLNNNGIYGSQGIPSASTYPGSRGYSTGRTDSAGNLWLFGGYGFDAVNGYSSLLNDLWKYDRSSNSWTWVNGSSSSDQIGDYGTKGTSSITNHPGARYGAVSWMDASNNLWILGGISKDSLGGGSNYGNDLWQFKPTTGEWTWKSGSNKIYRPGLHGTQGTPSPTHQPGARKYFASWIDKDQKIWIFGGSGMPGSNSFSYLNDLWNYDPKIDQWTWVSGSSLSNGLAAYGVQGTPSVSQIPGARGYLSGWMDNVGNLWLFGGWGLDSSGAFGNLNDLWKFNPSDKTWTWVSGSNTRNAWGIYGIKGTGSTSNTPGAREDFTTWVDSSGNFWLLGGNGLDSAGNYGALNDLWRFEPTTSKWTWMSGLNVRNALGIYGVKGTSSAVNFPGGRGYMGNWIDATGNVWIFGGQGIDATGAFGNLNDMWKYEPTSNQWTWMSGPNLADQAGLFGTKGIANASNLPSPRDSYVTWRDYLGNLWMLGGFGVDPLTSKSMAFNDVWKFNPTSGQWTWMGGSSTSDARGIYNQRNLGSAITIPGARFGAAGLIDKNGAAWIFGGGGMDGLGNGGFLDDLWIFQP